MTSTSSRLPGFYKASLNERRQRVADASGLSQQEIDHLQDTGNLDPELVEHMVENTIGTMNVPIGIATNFIIDQRETLVPMATEESSVIAAASNAARQCRSSGGIYTSTSGSLMIAQVQLVDVPNPAYARQQILEHREDIQHICDDSDPVLLSLGGGFKDMEVRLLETGAGPMVITHLIVDTQDAMGANAVNSMAEAVAPSISQWTQGQTYLRILTNLADRRLVRARATWQLEDMGGETVRDGMLTAYELARADPYRAATHNKGIMNGVNAVALATGNDTRAIEAGAHAYAAQNGGYASLTRWEQDQDGNLTGVLEMPMAMGLVGGATKAHPTAGICLKIMQAQTAAQLGGIAAAVGLAQNFAALRALATTGVQQGHMALHARNIALMAGAKGADVDAVANELVTSGTVRTDAAEKILANLHNQEP